MEHTERESMWDDEELAWLIELMQEKGSVNYFFSGGAHKNKSLGQIESSYLSPLSIAAFNPDVIEPNLLTYAHR